MRMIWRAKRVRTVTIIVVSLLAIPLLAACGGELPAPTPEPAASSGTPLPDPTAVPDPALGDVVWATRLDEAGGPGDVISTFWREETAIHAVVPAVHLRRGDTVSSIWTINGIEIEGAGSMVRIDTGAAEGWISFSLTWHGATLWPTGELGVTITTSSGASTSSTIRIVSNQ